MGRMELEVKVLNINEKDMIQKIENLGGKFVEKSNQYLYTYDLPTIYGRYIDILTQLNNPESEIKKEVAISKLELLFFEIDNLLNEEDKAELKEIIKTNTFTDLLEKENLIEILNKPKSIEIKNNFEKSIISCDLCKTCGFLKRLEEKRNNN